VTSLRPLATIALLAAVGVFLYMKINDSEPKLSPELEEWSTSELEVGEPIGAPTTGATASTPSTNYPSTSSDAPPFASASVAPLPKGSPASGDAAPPWSPGPLPVAAPSAQQGDSSASDAESSPVARSAEATPDLPAMPPLPGAGATEVEAAPIDPLAGGAASASTEDSETEPTSSDAPPAVTTAPARGSMFPAARVAAQSAADRGDLAQALTILSEWYGDPSLTPAESQEVNELLAQLAGSVIYEGPPAHRLAAPHFVQAGETLESIAAQYEIPWQLLAKINGIADGAALAPGQELKVIPGPFSALIDLSERRMTLMLERRYAGQFALEIDPAVSVEEGEWKVDQKLLTPVSGGMYGAAAGETEDHSLLLASVENPTGQPAVLRGPGPNDAAATTPTARVLHLKAAEIGDVYDILSVGSRVTIRR
jgi:LysM repeat protein